MSPNRLKLKGAADQQALRKALDDAIAHIAADRLDEAVRVLEANRQALKTPVGFNILGDVRLRQGNPREALKAFDAAVKLAPSFPEAHANRGVALQEMGRLDEALAAEERALGHRPDYATAHFNRGNILKQMQRFDEAIAAYDKALKDRPGLVEARLNRGAALMETNRTAEALADFQEARKLAPDLIGAYLGQAKALGALGRKPEALAILESALAVAPDDPDVRDLKHDLTNEALTVADMRLASDPGRRGRARGAGDGAVETQAVR